MSDDALLDVLTGKATPLGKLAVRPAVLHAGVEAQRSDVAHDPANPLYRFGFGLRY